MSEFDNKNENQTKIIKKKKIVKKIKKKDDEKKNNPIQQDIFIRTVLIDKVRLKPNQISSNLKDVLQWILEKQYEGKCSYHGFIRPNSIKVFNYSMGKIFDASLNGDVDYHVQYYAYLCNPAIGSIVPAIVTNKNNFGVLAESFVDNYKRKDSVLEIIVVKSHQTDKSIDLDSLKENDKVNVEILGKKFELNDKKISAWGRIVKSSKNSLLDHVELIDEHTKDYIENIEDEKTSLGSSDDDLSNDEEENEEEDEEDERKTENDPEEEIIPPKKKKDYREAKILKKKSKKDIDSDDEDEEDDEVLDEDDDVIDDLDEDVEDEIE